MKNITQLLLIILLSTVDLQAQEIKNSIQGIVRDSKTGEEILNCNIFLSGTQWGTTSNNKGYYNIKSIIPSQYEIVFSMIGYERKSVIIEVLKNSILKIDINLNPKSYELDDVLVSSDYPDAWEEDLKIFKKYFLGNTEFASDCIIENEIYINFTNPMPHILKAYISQPLVIKNYALGFKIDCELKKFEFNNNENKVQYVILTHFSSLDSSDENILKEWKKNRYRAYLGSKDHFLYALKKNSFIDEGFELSTSIIPNIHGQNYFRDEIFTSESILTKGYFGGANTLNYEHFLQIKYNQSGELKTPVSWLKLLNIEVTLDQYGVPIEIMPFETYGSWANSGISNLLPKYYYVLNNNELIN